MGQQQQQQFKIVHRRPYSVFTAHTNTTEKIDKSVRVSFYVNSLSAVCYYLIVLLSFFLIVINIIFLCSLQYIRRFTALLLLHFILWYMQRATEKKSLQRNCLFIFSFSTSLIWLAYQLMQHNLPLSSFVFFKSRIEPLNSNLIYIMVVKQTTIQLICLFFSFCFR